MTLRFQIFLGAANVAWWITFFPVFQLLIPMQATQLGGDDPEAVIALVTACGSAVALFATPLAGALSDRTTSRWGRRRPWLLAGMLGTGAALALMANAPGVAILAGGFMIAQLFGNTMYGVLTAIIPDKVPVRQRGIASAVFGLSIPVATVIGAVVVGTIVSSVQTGYYALIAIMAVILVPFILFYREPALPRSAAPSFRLKRFLADFWVSPRLHPDFALAWVARFLVFAGYSLGTGAFLFLFVQDVIGYEQLFPGREVREGVATLQIISTLTLIPASIISGVISDRMGRRKPFVAGSSVIIALGLLLIGLVPVWGVALVAAAVIGAGFGVFLGIDVALITQILPSAASRGKDLGVINVANALPQIVAPLAGALIIDAFGEGSNGGYVLLYIAAAVSALLGGALVGRIRSVR